MQQQRVGIQNLPTIPKVIAGWHSWSPRLCRPGDLSDLMKRCEEACAFSGATDVILVDHKNVGSLNSSSWKGVDMLVREQYQDLLKSCAIDGNLMCGQMNSLYAEPLSYGLWEEIFTEPATITVRSQLMENIRILLFYVTVFSFFGHDAEVNQLKPLLDLARDGFLPLGLSPAHGKRFVIITG